MPDAAPSPDSSLPPPSTGLLLSGGGARAGNLVADIFDAYYAMKDGSLTLDETGAGETADTTADGQDAVPETVENNDALADDTAPAEQPAA